MENIVVIFNPKSGNRPSDRDKEFLIVALEPYTLAYSFYETGDPNEIKKITEEAVQNKVEKIIIAGGDGSINVVINIIAQTDICMGIVPTGSANVLAKSLGIDLNIDKAVSAIFEGETKYIDLGRLNGSYFAISAGCGFNAEVIKNTTTEKKNVHGAFAYYLEGMKQFANYENCTFNLEYNGKKETLEALNVMFINTHNTFGALSEQFSLSDDLLDVIVYSPDKQGDYVNLIWTLLTTQQENTNENIHYFRSKQIHLDSDRKIPVHIDGDIITTPPIDVESVPKALKIAVPPPEKKMIMSLQEIFKSIIN
jgi:YegS/Rv2252/BmrU family lipid kinase